MEFATIETLTALNRAFYDAHADAFADTRPRLAPGIQRVLGAIRPGARVLEIGCGDGKVGRWLARHKNCWCLGVDASAGMIDRAQRYTEQEAGRRKQEGRHPNITSFFLPPSSFLLADVTAPTWTTHLPIDPFDWILSFATFHHLPGFETRARVLGDLAQRLAPGGEVVLSNWQFTRSARLMKRVAAWSAVGLTEADVEPGDYLLTWERGGQRGLRYVHLVAEAEVRQLAERAGLEVAEVFQSDGGKHGAGQLTDYVRLRNRVN